MLPWCSLALTIALAFDGAPDWTINSDWQTEYQDFGRRIQKSPISLRNGAGAYGPRGRLLNTFYCPSVRHPRGDVTPALIGEWRMDGLRGYFVFRVPDRNGNMDGYWGQFDRFGHATVVIGSWDGKLVKTLPAARPNVMPVAPPTVPKQQDVAPLPVFAALPKFEARFGMNAKYVDLSWVKVLNQRKNQVGALTLKVGMNVNINGSNQFRPAGEQFGTCFLVGKGVGITARHCVTGLSMPTQVNANFLSPNDPDGNVQETHSLIAAPIQLSTLDVAILLFDTQRGNWPAQYISLLQGLDNQGKLLAPQTKTPLVVQYPGGQGWRMSFQGELIDVNPPDQYVHHTAPTEAGSSGAPVFGSHWQLMGVHSGALATANLAVRADLLVRELRRTLANDPNNKGVLSQMGL